MTFSVRLLETIVGRGQTEEIRGLLIKSLIRTTESGEGLGQTRETGNLKRRIYDVD